MIRVSSLFSPSVVMRLSDDVGLLPSPLDSLLDSIGLTGVVTGEKGVDFTPLPNALLPSKGSINTSINKSINKSISESIIQSTD